MECKVLNDEIGDFQNFVILQSKMLEQYSLVSNVGITTLQLDELFAFYHNHFNEFHKKENIILLLAYSHRCLKVLSQYDCLKCDIGTHMIKLIRKYHDDENALNIVVQIVYQIMTSIDNLENQAITISENLLQELITILLTIKSKSLISRYVACIQLYLKMFPENESSISTTLWPNVKTQLESNLKHDTTNETAVDILIQMIDDFNSVKYNYYNEPILINTIQHLVKSDQRKYRKCGYYLLKKVVQYYIKNMNSVGTMWVSADHKKQVEQSWIIYITILENLEEEQSHLILPSLENLEQLIKNKHLESSWFDILYKKILTHNNNLVLRWSINFVLKTFSCDKLPVHTLKHFLQATNSNLLYNFESYSLDTSYYSSFLKEHLTEILTLLPEIDNWKSIPLYIWLEKIIEVELVKSVSLKVILNISACVRKLQNIMIRQKAIQLCNKLFEDSIKQMSMEEYVMYVETLYNSEDLYDKHEIFFSKKSSFIESNGLIFNQRFYKIFTKNEIDVSKLLSFLSDIPIKKHGWLMYAPFKYRISESNGNLIHKLYKLDLNMISYENLNETINTLQKYILTTNLDDQNELRECHCAALSCYIYHKSKFENEDEDTLRSILSYEIDCSIIEVLAENLFFKSDIRIDLWLIDELLKYNSKIVFEYVAAYLCKVYDEVVITKYLIFVYEKYNFIPTAFADINLLKYSTDKLLNDLASKGETRIEEAFCFHRFDKSISDLRLFCLQQIREFGDKQFILDILKYHTDLTKRKPRYFENSNEHRIKLRIAICVFSAIKHSSTLSNYVLDEIWDILLNENNQANVTFIYEYILGCYETREDVILNMLQKAQHLTSSQQVSIISVSYTYVQSKASCVTNEAKLTLYTIFLALSMGSNFQTRLLAQMSLYQLLKTQQFNSILKDGQQIMESIEYATGAKLSEYLNDIRLHIYNLSKKFDLIDIILKVTDAPFDEFFTLCEELEDDDDDDDFKQIEMCCKMFKSKFKMTINKELISKSTMNNQIQRKMNPVNDLTEPHNLMVYPTVQKSAEMFVIASLIDKVPNLGGIARTCEVLGIQNLAMDSKMHIEKNDFKNLSMTAEKNLNILEVKPKDLKEFLMKKKLEGFNIVGAEQTSHSQNFNNFNFPQKCILLLGHEKYGIPAPLLGLLDYAVEIPQFGQVRSLNVHVTAAIFMWEFCKQHLIQKQ